ncbi:MAG: FadR/GntR family transcriptional regulator [Blastocatellia bacterium]
MTKRTSQSQAELEAPLFENVMERIEDLFRTKKLRPGSKLPPEKELAAMLKVSRHTLREVLKALNLFGIIRSRAGDGTYVQRSLSGVFAKAIHLCTLLEEVDFIDLLDTRMAIEPMLARMAAEKAGRQQIDLLRREIQGMESSLHDLDRYLRHEIAFHSGIMSAADSPILKSVMEALADLLLEGRRTITYEQTDRQNLLLHVRILEAIEARDPEAAYQAMMNHLLDNRRHYLAFYKQKNSVIAQPGETIDRRKSKPLPGVNL